MISPRIQSENSGYNIWNTEYSCPQQCKEKCYIHLVKPKTSNHGTTSMQKTVPLKNQLVAVIWPKLESKE